MSYIRIGGGSSSSASNSIVRFGADSTGTTLSNAAILSCIASTGSAYVPVGTFKVSDLTINSAKIYGPGTIVKDVSATHALILTGTNPEVEGLTFNTNDSAVNGEAEINLGDGCIGPVIRNCTFTGTTYACVSADINGNNDTSLTYVSPVDGLLFEQNKVSGSYSRHLYLHSVKNIRIVNNSFKNSLRDSVRLRQATEKCLISGNVFDNIGEENQDYGTRPENWSSLLSYTLGTKVAIPTGAAPGIYECIVSNSTIGANPTTTGSSEWSHINTHYFETKDAVDAYWSGRELIITNNIINQTAQIGLDIKGTEPQGLYSSSKVIISHNVIQGVWAAAINIHAADLLADSSFAYTSDYLITENYLKGNNREKYDVSQSPIRLAYGVQNAIISNNMVVENFARGITVANTETSEICKNITITGNQVISNGIPAGVSNIGINVGPVDGLIITENIVKNLAGNTTQTLGINLKDYEQVGSTIFETPLMSTIVRDNICTGNASSGDRYEVLLNNGEFPTLNWYVDSDNTGSVVTVATMARTYFSGGADSGYESHIRTQAYIQIQGRIVIKSRIFGTIGNASTFSIQQDTGADKSLSLTIAPAIFGGNELIVKLPTDSGGSPVAVTIEELEVFLKQKLGQGILVYEHNNTQPRSSTSFQSDPSQGLELIDHFISGTAVGNTGWTLLTNDGSIGMTTTGLTTEHPGVVKIGTSTSSTAFPVLTQGSGVNILLGGTTTGFFEFMGYIPTLSTVTEEFTYRLGLHDLTTVNTTPTDGVYFEYDRLSNGDFWSVVTYSNGVATTTVTTQAVTAASWIKFKIDLDADGATFYINDVAVSSKITTNYPTGVVARVLSPAFQVRKSAGTTERTFNLDYTRLKLTF